MVIDYYRGFSIDIKCQINQTSPTFQTIDILDLNLVLFQSFCLDFAWTAQSKRMCIPRYTHLWLHLMTSEKIVHTITISKECFLRLF